MSTEHPQGHVTASIVAGPLEDSHQPTTNVGHMLTMGHHLYLHISPETAQQWINTLAPIAKEAK